MYFYNNISENDVIIGSLRFNGYVTTGIASFMTLFSLTIVVLNSLVVLTFIKNKSLQLTRHYFILSLAVCDISIGLIPVNTFTPYLIYGYWYFGLTACNYVLVICYGICTVSTLTLLAIAMDRFLAVFYPIFHRFNYTKYKILAITIIIWIFAFLIWIPGVILHPSKHEHNCFVEFIDNWYISLITAFLSYYGPLLFTTISYLLISYKLVDRHKSIYSKHARKRLIRRPQNNSNNSNNSNNKTDNQYKTSELSVTPRDTTLSSINSNNESIELEHSNKDELNESLCSNNNSITSTMNKSGSKTNESKCVFKDVYVSERNRRRNIKGHRRSLRILLFVILAFGIAWLPYHVMLTIVSTGKTVPIPAWNFAYIFGWANSLLNPFCYAFGNRKFKQAFLSLFPCRKRPAKEIYSWKSASEDS